LRFFFTLRSATPVCRPPQFSRSFYLPQTVQRVGIKATYRDGILEIHIPKAEEAKLKQIAISVN